MDIYMETSKEELLQDRETYLAMDRMALEHARRQFCLDTCLDWEDYQKNPERKVYIQKTVYEPGTSYIGMEGARKYQGSDGFFNAIVCLGQLFLTVDEQIYDWAVETLGDVSPEWFCQYENLRRIDEKLREYGRQVGDTHLYYLPSRGLGKDAAAGERAQRIGAYDVQWYHQEQLLRFRDNNRFKRALGFSATQPDALAVALLREKAAEEGKEYDQSKLAGMAGVSIDGTYLWQVGIDVDDDCRGQGLGTQLVKELVAELYRQGVTVFYGTSESHSISQTVAYRAGFVPAFATVYAVKKD